VLRVIRLEEENGNERTINLRDVDFGAAIPEGFFTFTPPPGALVITP
jgi:outer membrane lipoprotein-sorting protein